MATQDSPDIYARALGPAALGLEHIYQANPSWPWYNYYLSHTSRTTHKIAHQGVHYVISRKITYIMFNFEIIVNAKVKITLTFITYNYLGTIIVKLHSNECVYLYKSPACHKSMCNKFDIRSNTMVILCIQLLFLFFKGPFRSDLPKNLLKNCR